MRILEELVDYILNNINPYPGNIEVAENTSYLVRLIKQFDKENNNGWIPTVEKLPRTGGYYLVSTKHETPRVMIGFYYKDLNLWNYWMSTLEIKSVTAWQPLPEQYKEEQRVIN